ncbi:MAG: MFS transporter [Solirubrobacterales bacterium]|nr:MFS transporter [Solirubrobacterales bacterium]
MPAIAAPRQIDRFDALAWAALFVLSGAIFLDALDVSMVGIALPSIRKDLSMSTTSLQWVVSAYVLGYGGLMLLGGRAADLLGRRRVFLASLGVFVLASALGGFASDGSLLIATRFIKGVSAAFTVPTGLSIITTTFAEGPARNKALSIYTATAASGWSLGLVFGGALTQIGWRWTFFLPVPLALVILAAARRSLAPDAGSAPGLRALRRFDVPGAATITAAMLLLVYTVVSAPTHGWGSARTLLSFVAVAALTALFAMIERRSHEPLVRLGILRSGPLVRANLGAMAVVGGWFGVQFITTLYFQQLRGWSPIETALAFLPAGILVSLGAPQAGRIVDRFGTTRPIAAGMLSFVVGYVLFLGLHLNSPYFAAILPTILLAGAGFMLAYGPLNMAATAGVADHEQGLASGLVNTSFQVGGAIGLAIVTAVISSASASSGAPAGSSRALLHGYQAGLVVSVIIALLGLLATLWGPARAHLPARVALRSSD